LFTNIDAGSFKFNKIEAIVYAKSNYVFRNDKYEADVFIAASDTTVAPEIILSDSTKLEIINGKGKYWGNTKEIGFYQWSGAVQLQHPATKEILKFPFSAEFQVAEPAIVVSPMKLNVFYIGVDNPVEISVSGVPEFKLKISIGNNATIKKAESGYSVRVNGGSETTIYVSEIMDNGITRNIGTKTFRIKTVPDPVAKVLVNGSNVAESMIVDSVLAGGRVEAILENFDFNLSFRISGFRVSAVQGGYVTDADSNNGRMTKTQSELIKSLPPKSKVTIENITAVGPDGRPRKLNDLIFRIK